MKRAYALLPGQPWLIAATAAGVLSAACGLCALGESALDSVGGRDHAEMARARASQAIVTTSYADLSILAYDDSAETGRMAPLVFLDALREAKDELDEALQLAPDKTVPIAMLRERFEHLAESAQAAFLVGNATPGLTRATELTPAQLAELASGANMAAKVDVQLQALAKDVRALADDVAARTSGVVARSRVQFGAAVAALAAVIIAALAAFRLAGRRDAVARLSARRSARRELRETEVRGFGEGPRPASPLKESSASRPHERAGAGSPLLLAAPMGGSAAD